MIFIFMTLGLGSVFALPVHLTPKEIQYPYESDTEWQCYSTSQIKKLECRKWVDDDEKADEHSDLDLEIETENEIHEYGLNDANSVCSEFKKDFLDLLRNQKYFCILGNPLGIHDVNFHLNRSKSRKIFVYQCLKTPIGQVAWHGGFGFCVDD